MEKIEVRKRPRHNTHNVSEDNVIFHSKSKNYRKLLPFLILSMSFGIFAFICWQAYENTIKPIDINSIETVARDISPIRAKPDDPGGIVFLNQDKEIYNNIKRSNQIEKFDFAEQDTGSEIQSVLSKMNREKVRSQLEIEVSKEQKQPKHNVEQLPVEQIQKKSQKIDLKLVETLKLQSKEKVTTAKKEVSSVFDLVEENGNVSVFVFSSTNKQKVKQMLNKLKPALKGKSIRLIEEKNFFRLKVSGFNSEAQAEKFCLSQKLKC